MENLFYMIREFIENELDTFGFCYWFGLFFTSGYNLLNGFCYFG